MRWATTTGSSEGGATDLQLPRLNPFAADSRLWLWLARLARWLRPRRKIVLYEDSKKQTYIRNGNGTLRRVDKIALRRELKRMGDGKQVARDARRAATIRMP